MLDLSKYGANPVQANDSTPQQQAEPNVVQRIWNDIQTRGQKNVDIYKQNTAAGDTSLPHVAEGATKIVANTFGGIGDSIGEIIKSVPGGSQAIDAIGGIASQAFKGVTDKLANTQLFKDAAKNPEATKTLEQMLSTGQSLGDIANNILAAEGARATAVKVSDTVQKLVDKIPEAPPTPPAGPSKQVTKLQSEWQRPIDTPAKTFDKTREVLAKSPETPKFLAEQGIDPRGLVEDGKYSAPEAEATAQALRDTAGKMSRDTLRPSLEKADYFTPKTPVTDLESQIMSRAKSEYGVTAGDAGSVASNVQSELDALAKKYPNGMSLTNLHDEGIIYNQNGGYKPFASAADTNKSIANRAIGSILKDSVAAKAPPELPVTDFNKYLASYYKGADYVESLAGKKAPVTMGQALRSAALKYTGAGLGEMLGHGVVSAFAGYSLGKALEHAIENLSAKARSAFLGNLEVTNPEAFKAVESFLNAKYEVPALPAPSFTPLGARTPGESSVTSVAAEKGPVGVDTATGKFKTTYTSTPK